MVNLGVVSVFSSWQLSLEFSHERLNCSSLTDVEQSLDPRDVLLFGFEILLRKSGLCRIVKR